MPFCARVGCALLRTSTTNNKRRLAPTATRTYRSIWFARLRSMDVNRGTIGNIESLIRQAAPSAVIITSHSQSRGRPLRQLTAPEGRQYVQEEHHEKYCTESLAYGGGSDSPGGLRPAQAGKPDDRYRHHQG